MEIGWSPDGLPGAPRRKISGIPASGKSAMVTGITISRVADGKIVEEWQNWDTLGMKEQLERSVLCLPETLYPRSLGGPFPPQLRAHEIEAPCSKMRGMRALFRFKARWVKPSNPNFSPRNPVELFPHKPRHSGPED
jgi:hypothetical protein